jgi:predicted negative regulator of RcsB-dependent stress response
VEDLTDNEREEQLRRWWSDNWAWIIGGVALGLALLAGWQYWQRYQVQRAEQDEESFRAVVNSLDRNQRDEALKQAGELRDRRPDSPYADQADLALARAAADAGEYDQAATYLRRVADGSSDPELRRVAQSRLARVLIEQGKPDEALALLDAVQAGAFAPLFHEIRGDAYVAKGDPATARREYDEALKAVGTDIGLDREFVELKRDELAAEAPTGSSAPAESSTPQADAR